MPGFENEDVEEFLSAVGARSIPITRSGAQLALSWCATYLSTLGRDEVVGLLRQIELELPVTREALPPGTVMVPSGSGDPTRVFYVRGRSGGKAATGQITLPQPAMALACRAAGSEDASSGLPDASIRSGAGARIYLLPELQVKLGRSLTMRGSSWPMEKPPKSPEKP